MTDLGCNSKFCFTGLMAMAHLFILSLLIAATKLHSVPANSCKKKIEINNCPRVWIIMDKSDKVLELVCVHSKSGIRLQMSALPKDCSEILTGTFKCSKIVVNVGKKHRKICRKCCRGITQCPVLCKNKCEDRKGIHIKSAQSLNAEIEIKDSTCDLSETQSVFNGTSSSLQLFDETKSWIEALQSCDQLSSSLVEITNQTVWEELKTILVNKNELQNGVWVGLERSIFGTNVKWQWTSGAKAERSDWISSFPANGFNNHCGKIVWNNQSQTIQLLDANCHDKLPFICQDKTEMLEE